MADVSVIVTAHNRERYIAQSLESVLAQTMKDIEVLVVDDASTDGTLAIVERIARRDSRVRIIRNPRNLGDYPNRNYAAGVVTTPFFKYHDSDDVMYPHCVEVMWSMLNAEPNADLALSGNGAWAGGVCPMLLTPRLAYQREFLGTGLFHLGPAAAMFRTASFHRLGGFPEQGTGSDYIYWLAACRDAHILLVPGDLFFWRQHNEQESRKPVHLMDQLRAKASTWAALAHPACPLTPDEREIARSNWAYIAAREVVRRAKAGRQREAWLYLRHSGLSVSDWARYLRPPRRSASAGIPPSNTETH